MFKWAARLVLAQYRKEVIDQLLVQARAAAHKKRFDVAEALTCVAEALNTPRVNDC